MKQYTVLYTQTRLCVTNSTRPSVSVRYSHEFIITELYGKSTIWTMHLQYFECKNIFFEDLFLCAIKHFVILLLEKKRFTSVLRVYFRKKHIFNFYNIELLHDQYWDCI